MRKHYENVRLLDNVQRLTKEKTTQARHNAITLRLYPKVKAELNWPALFRPKSQLTKQKHRAYENNTDGSHF